MPPYEIAIDEGEWAGWSSSRGDPFADGTGPFYHRVENDAVVCAMRVEPRHLNGGGAFHGGAMMTFADYCLFALAGALGDPHTVTVSLRGDYLGSVPGGALLTAKGELTRRTRSMSFLRGLVTAEDQSVFAFDGILKRAGGQ
ncbi:PaaI family thioesterase [Sphingomonas montanisoli]|uniref:PaaI family thioesterase n=1 Tax=Sphingomonas montanisoli TaxID=2606412 RepID=A0A5D9CDI3_9SPHN|nr:PaaI family thioesterase [Sphingomonas montanisoli]TZG29406.1 PaaI family thioesterase [Sphingomonas montanisoli]